DILLREVKDAGTRGIFRSLNEIYPVGAKKPNSRYMGEILRVDDLHGVVKLQQEREFRFFSQDEVRKLELPGNLAVSKPSPYTHNIVAYIEREPEEQRVYRSEEHTSELQSRENLVCRLLLEKKNK